MSNKDDGNMRSFDTGATRDTNENKLDYDGFLSPVVLLQYAKFMNMNRLQSDGELRDADNWQKGIPMDVYRKSENRHHMEFWQMARNKDHLDRNGDIHMVAAACGILFNVMGYLHEWLKENKMVDLDGNEPTVEMRERQVKVAEAKNQKRCAEDEYCKLPFNADVELSPRGEVELACLRLGLDPNDYMLSEAEVAVREDSIQEAETCVDTPADCDNRMLRPIIDRVKEWNTLNGVPTKVNTPEAFKPKEWPDFRVMDDHINGGTMLARSDYQCPCEKCTPNKGVYGENYLNDNPADPPVGFRGHTHACPTMPSGEIGRSPGPEKVIGSPKITRECLSCRYIHRWYDYHPCSICKHNLVNSNLGDSFWEKGI